MKTIPGQALMFSFFLPEKNQPLLSFGFHPVRLVKFFVPPPFFFPELLAQPMNTLIVTAARAREKIRPLFIFIEYFWFSKIKFNANKSI